jgi:hypothetical protein
MSIESFPIPTDEIEYSGNISYRTSPKNHKFLAEESRRRGVSISKLIDQSTQSDPNSTLLGEIKDRMDDLASRLARIEKRTNWSLPYSAKTTRLHDLGNTLTWAEALWASYGVNRETPFPSADPADEFLENVKAITTIGTSWGTKE